MLVIRKLQKKDAGQVAMLIRQLTQNIIKPQNLVRRVEGLVKQKNSRFMVAEFNRKVVGFGGLAWYVIPSKGLIAWVEELVVDQKNRRQGIATALMEQLLKYARQKRIQQVKLTSSPMAKSLYEKLGFKKKDNEYLVKYPL